MGSTRNAGPEERACEKTTGKAVVKQCAGSS